MSWESDARLEAGDERPGVADCYRDAVAAFVSEPVALLVLALVALGLGLASGHALAAGGVLGVVGAAVGAGLAIPVAWTLDHACLRVVRGQPIRQRDLRATRRRYADVVVAGAVASVCVIVGLLLLVVPGVVLYCRLRFVPYLVLDEGLSAGAALRASLDLTRGDVLPILGISAVGFAGVLLGTPLLLVGGALADAAARLATASFYHASVEPSLEVVPVEAEPLFSEPAF